MASQRGVGIDIGSNFLKIVEIKLKKGRYYLTDMFSLKIGSAEINGREAILEEQLQDIIQRRLNGNSLRRGTVGISGKGVLHRYIHIPPVPPWKVAMMVDFEVQSSGVGEEDISYDTCLLALPKGLSNEYTVLTSMAKSGHLDEMLEGLRNAGVKAEQVLPSPLASFNAFITDFGRIKDKTILIADVGAYNTELTILKENNLYFVRTLPIGGRTFTEAIQEEMKLKPAQAEELKKEKGKILIDGPDKDDDDQTVLISEALKRAAVQISSQIQASVRFAATNIRLENLSIDEFYVSGGGARVKGLLQFWQSLLGKPVYILNPLKSLSLSEFPQQRVAEITELPSGFTTAVGLAVSSCSDQMVSMNILPEQEKKRIEFFHKKLPLYISLFLFLAATLLFTIYNVRIREEVDTISSDIQITNRGIESKRQLFRKAVREAENVLEKYRFIILRGTESQFLLRIIDCFNEERPQQVWLKNIQSFRDPKTGRIRAVLTVYSKESETQTAHNVFEMFKKKMEGRVPVKSVTVDNIEDYSDTEKKLIIVSFTVHPASGYGGS